MSFLRNNMSTLELAEAVSQLLPPTPSEVERCDAASPEALHELFLLKAAMACEYAMGMLEQLGMKPEGIAQFYEIYTSRLAKGFAAVFSSNPAQAVAQLRSRMQDYGEALHRPHPEDPHLHVADRFTRFCGLADDPRLVSLCLDTCKSLNRAFLEAIAALGKEAP